MRLQCLPVKRAARLRQRPRYQRHRQHRNHRADPRRECARQPAHLAHRFAALKLPERERRAETDRRIAMAMKAPTHPQPDLPQNKARDDRDPRRKAPPTRFPGRHQQPILEHPVVIDRDRHEHHVAPVGAALLDNILEQAKLERLQAAVKAEATLGKHCLCHAAVGGHADIARQHPAVEIPARAAADEIGPHRPDHAAERPDPRPFPHRVGQRRALRRQPCHQNIIHVGAVVHDENDRRLGVDSAKRRLVEMPEPDAVERLAQHLRHTDGKAEIEACAETRDDLAGVAAGALEGDALGNGLGAGMLGHGAQHGRIVDQPLDHVISPCELERLDGPFQPGIEPRHRPLQPAAKEPAHRGKQEMRGKGDGGERHQHDQGPERHFHDMSHARHSSRVRAPGK